MGAMATQPTHNPPAPPGVATLPAPLLLTLELAEPAQSLFQTLRERHFPAARNQVPAHVSLFHALPGAARVPILDLLRALAAAPPAITVEAPRSLGHGVAFPLTAPELLVLRTHLADAWQPWLSAQDRQPYRPHVTIQNKVTPEQARETQARLARGFVPWCTHGAALLLWRYLGGPWEALDRIELIPQASP